MHNTNDHFKFPDDVISELTSLESISLDIIASGQKSVPFGRKFSELTSLRKMKTDFCNLATLSNNTFADLPYLDSIDLNGCLVKSYILCAMCGKQLKLLSLASVELSYTDFWRFIADFGALSVETMTDILPTIIDLPEPFFDFLYNIGVQKLLLNKNRFIKAIPATFYTFGKFSTTLKVLDFSDNHLKEIRYNMARLSRLDLQGNDLGQFLATNTYMDSNKTALIEINLSLNYIHMLNFSIFHGHSMLEKINLSNNTLPDITFDVSSLKALMWLDLSSNKISIFKKKTIASLTTLIETNNLKIDLSANVLQCSCHSEYFIKWIADNSRSFLYSQTYKCKFGNGTVIVLGQIEQIALQLQKECASHTALIICISVAISTACIALVFGLVYRYRWKIRYMYYMTKSRYTQYTPLNTGIDHTYNAFISYADTDKDFVINEWIPQIEHNSNLKLCIHQRDFVPGEEINHNITRSIHESKKTICIITKDFLDSHFCMFEFNMARMESIYSRNGQSVLFLVFYEQILPKELPLFVLEHVQQQSYIEYPHDEQGNVVFWEKTSNRVIQT
ncbi:unnamed protein product [Mytilus coruscus]|uniref:TIR domain-containing protein n=1 Tax=Mytilus coruscus TaxID=42192 RepID=A0A6J8DTR1_MYTCO|nr:unnamed protein product [Mytilus coruscus]